MRVLLIEDDTAMMRSIEMILKSDGFDVTSAQCGVDGLEFAELYTYDVIIVDLQLPDISGFDVVKTLRSKKNSTPVLVLTGNSVVESKVKALKLGADDYLTKPFHKDELTARLQAILRRSSGHPQSVVTVGQLAIDLDDRAASVEGHRLPLTVTEYKVLELLMLRKGKPVTKDMLLNHLYGGMDEPERKIIDVLVCKLRQKIAKACNGENYVRTLWGIGYTASDEPVEQMAA